MAISDAEKVDFLWKKFFGTSKTASAADKLASNETIPSPNTVYPDTIWKDSATIPAAPPAENASDSVVAVLTGFARLRLTSDPTSPPNVAWLAADTFGAPATRTGDFIPPTFGSGYAVKVWLGDPDGGPAARIFPDTTGEEWVFDYAAGVLIFEGAIPSGKAATIGVGTVSVAANGVYIEVYRYIGRRGAGLDADALGSLAFQNANNVAITGGDLSDVTLHRVTVDGGWF